MTPEQQALKDKLDASPTAWTGLTADQQKVMRETLRPNGPFTAEQRDFLRGRWLPITAEQLAQANALLPKNTDITVTTDSNGDTWVLADLLTDCMEPKDTYHAIAPILATLPITLVPPERFPQPSNEI